MFGTHILVGAVIGYLSSFVAPTTLNSTVFAGMVGGLIPELDFLIGHHRKTLHFPFSYFIAALILFPFYVFTGFNPLLLVLVGLLSAGIHSFMDIFAGAELRSWDEREWKQTAVYDHVRRTWIKPRRWAYGGSPQDLLLASVCFAAMFYMIESTPVRVVLTVMMGLSLLYTLTIKPFSERFVGDRHETLNSYVRRKIVQAVNYFRVSKDS